MRSILLVACMLACGAVVPALAGTSTTVSVETYPISGASGEALVAAMNRNGPRHGFLARAIAQTRYAVDWELRWRRSGRSCRLVESTARLSIAYRYPALSRTASPVLNKRWKAFMAGVRRHEETHGRIAREMVAAAHRSAAKVGFADDPSCRRAKAEVERRVKATYAVYEKRQLRFDEVEHRDGGKVDRLLGSLIRGR